MISEKKAIRAAMKRQLKALSSQEISAMSSAICEQIQQLLNQKFPDTSTALNIASFAANPLEPNLSELHQLLPQHHFYYPHCTKDKLGEMHFYPCEDYASMRLDKYSIPAPVTTSAPPLSASLIDVILVPAYAFTRAGERLGKGGGYYDRYLAHNSLGVSSSTLTLGIAFSIQLLQALPTEKHDIKMNQLITEKPSQ